MKNFNALGVQEIELQEMIELEGGYYIPISPSITIVLLIEELFDL
jgi:hypothetical protein